MTLQENELDNDSLRINVIMRQRSGTAIAKVSKNESGNEIEVDNKSELN